MLSTFASDRIDHLTSVGMVWRILTLFIPWSGFRFFLFCSSLVCNHRLVHGHVNTSMTLNGAQQFLVDHQVKTLLHLLQPPYVTPACQSPTRKHKATRSSLAPCRLDVYSNRVLIACTVYTLVVTYTHTSLPAAEQRA